MTFANTSATIGTTEISLPRNASFASASTQTSDVVQMVVIDFGNLTAGSEFGVTLYEKVNSGSQRTAGYWTFMGAQSKPLFWMPSLMLGEGWDVSVQKLAGSDQTIAWSLRTESPTITFTNTSATVSTTERSLMTNATYSSASAQTTDAILQVWLDLNAVTHGDKYRMRLYEKTAAAGTQRLSEEYFFEGDQAWDLFASGAYAVGEGWDVTLTKISGTDRAIGWSLRTIA